MGFFKTSSALLFALSISLVGMAQQPIAKSFPITNGRKADGLPNKLRVTGTISQVDYAPPACGELIFTATFEVKLDRRLSGYEHPYVYLVSPCLYRPKGEDTLLNRRVDLTVTKQNENRRPCFFDLGHTPIDSRGLPYYCAERQDLLKAVETRPGATQVVPVEFNGELEKGNTYRALVKCDETGEWRTVVRVKMPYHHATRIEWLNLEDFAELRSAKSPECERRIVFEVVTKQIVKIDRNRWNTTYECRILSVE